MPKFQTGHIGLNVTDLHRSQKFYQDVFGFQVMHHSHEAGREFTFLSEDGALVLTLWQQSGGQFPTALPGLHHLSFQVDSIAAVREDEARVRAAGATLFHDGVVPHSEGGASGGIFLADPDGIRLEIFAPSGAEGRDAPAPGAPTCGFFQAHQEREGHMEIRLIRHATLLLRFAGRTILVDPMLGEAESSPAIPDTPNPRRNPLGPLPSGLPDWGTIDLTLVTHLHEDHIDEAAEAQLPKDKPVLCQPEDQGHLTEVGFHDVRGVQNDLGWEGITFHRTGGQHGFGEIGKEMTPVSGFVLDAPGEPTLYIAGDTLYCPEVEEALATSQPQVVVLNAGAAQFLEGGPITMDTDDIARVCRAAPGAKIVAVHMDSINHCLLTRADLRAFLGQEGLAGQVLVPEDGQTLTF